MRKVIAARAAALSGGGRWVVLTSRFPMARLAGCRGLAVAAVGTSASLDEWIRRRPWETIRTAMQEGLADPSWTELCFGTAFLAAGSGPGTSANNRGS